MKSLKFMTDVSIVVDLLKILEVAVLIVDLEVEVTIAEVINSSQNSGVFITWKAREIINAMHKRIMTGIKEITTILITTCQGNWSDLINMKADARTARGIKINIPSEAPHQQKVGINLAMQL